MQLSGPEILNRMSTPNPDNPNGKPDIIIQPFDPNSLGSNSYDLHLNKMLKVYTRTLPKGMTPAIKYTEGKKYSMRDNFTSFGYYLRYLLDRSKYDIRNPKYFIDPRDRKKETIDLEIPESGLILLPGIGYLGSTEEWTETYRLFPQIDGKSSTGRNFILNHHTAGRGDDGFCGTWTLEIQVLYPTMVFPLMPFGQIYYEEFIGDRKPYNENPNSHYNGQKGPTPAAEISNEMYREAIQKQK